MILARAIEATRRYGDTLALDHITLDVAAGGHSFDPVDRDVDLIAEHLEHPHRPHLIGANVFGDEDAHRGQRVGRGPLYPPVTPTRLPLRP